MYNMPHFTNGYQRPSTHLKEEVIHEGTWLRFSEITYLDPTGKERLWEATTRQTRIRGSDTDQVAAIAIYRRLLHYDVMVLVRQYRPALKAYTVEFPAGLLEPGETSADAVVRELREETGWHGEVTHMSTKLAVDPGCSSAIMRYATLKINGDAAANLNSRAVNSDGEFVDLLMIPVSEIHEHLKRLTKEGNLVDSRVEAFAIGLQMGLKFAKDAAKDAISTLQASLPLDGSSVRTGSFTGKQMHI